MTSNYGDSLVVSTCAVNSPSLVMDLQRDEGTAALTLPEMLLPPPCHTPALETLMSVHLFNSFIAFEYFMCATYHPLLENCMLKPGDRNTEEANSCLKKYQVLTII